MNRLWQKVLDFWKENPILRRVLRNTSYLFSSQMVGMILAMGQTILATRLLGKTSFGILTLVMAFATTVNQLFSFRMGEFIIRFMGKELVKKETDRAAAVAKISFMIEGSTSVLAFAAFMLLAPLGARYFVKDTSSLPLFYLYGFFILANITTETATGILQLFNRFKVQAGINLAQSIITAAIIAVAFIMHGSLTLIIWAYLIGKFITGLGPIIAAFITLHEKLGPGWGKAPLSLLPPAKEIAQFAVSTNLSGSVKMLVSSCEPLLIGLLLDAQAVALYNIATSIVNPLMIPVSQFINTTFPEMTKSIVARKWKELRQLLRHVTTISGVWTVFFFLVMLIFGPWILSIWGKEYIPAYSTMMILIVGYGVSNIFFWNRSLLLAFGKANIPLYIMAGVAIVKTALAFVFVPNHGITAEAMLLSGNFVVSVGLLVAIGLLMIRRSAEKDKLQLEPAK
jgi:Membrane protein involved in the export of O-antigen and teichoic acid